jgi:hypothetical protein
VVCTVDPGDDGNGRGITSPRPVNAPVCGVGERDGGCARVKETARASGATRCVGTEAAGTWASTMLGPRVIVNEDCPGNGWPDEGTFGLAAI